MLQKLEDLLQFTCGNPDSGIYRGKKTINQNQAEEIALREKVANEYYVDYMAEVSKHHSVPVMDHEIDRFLEKIPENGLILDIGGCWGWHWRDIAQKRSDINVLIIDFVVGNLVHAQNLLGPLVGTQVALMDADATDLPFIISDNFTGFDGVWTVQVFQHIPDFSKAVKEVARVLRKGGFFINYSLHKTPLNRFIYFLFRKKFHIEGELHGLFYLSRANKQQKKSLKMPLIAKYTYDIPNACFNRILELRMQGRKTVSWVQLIWYWETFHGWDTGSHGSKVLQ